MESLIKYSNRKIYSRDLKKYVTLDYIVGKVKGNEEVEVTEHKTGKNVTHDVLKQAILTLNVSKKGLLELIKNGI
jgi:polyhydroxyalkanoate synthesis regulator protein